MKQKDVAMIIVIAAVSAIVSFVVSGKIFVTPANRQQKVEAVDKIDPQFLSPSKKYFNQFSIDPTQLVTIGDNNNQNPFNGTSH